MALMGNNPNFDTLDFTKKNENNIEEDNIDDNDDLNNEENEENIEDQEEKIENILYNKSNDDIRRINNNYNNLMNIWKNRYGKRAQLYKKLNHQFDFDNYKRNNINNNPTVKRTNSILKMKEKNHISFTENNNNRIKKI